MRPQKTVKAPMEDAHKQTNRSRYAAMRSSATHIDAQCCASFLNGLIVLLGSVQNIGDSRV